MEKKEQVNKEEAVEKNDEQNNVVDEAENVVETEETKGDVNVDQEDAETTNDAEENEASVPSKEEELEKKLEETTNRLLRIQADYDNFRRRTKLEREADAKYRSQGLVEELLPVLDNFERALMVEPESEETKSLLQGVEMVYRQLQDALSKEGVKIIEAVGKPFDPHVHQAVMQVQVEDEEKETVVEELQKGYMLKDRVIRPSMVKVNG